MGYMLPENLSDREWALQIAVGLHQGRYAGTIEPGVLDKQMIRTARTAYAWLTGPAYMRLQIGPIAKQDDPTVTRPHGGTLMTQLHDDEQVEFSIKLFSARDNEVFDAAGTDDDVDWTLEGDASVATLEVSADTRTATVKADRTGTVVLKASFTRDNVDLFVTRSVDVVPGDVAKMAIAEGTVTKQDAGTPEQPTEPAPGEEQPEIPGAEVPTPEVPGDATPENPGQGA